jgi:hypothetical protein
MPRISQREIDFQELARQLRPHIEPIVRRLEPGARLSGGELWFADPAKLKDTSRDSASINIRTGAWHARSSGCCGRDVISLVAYLRSTSQSEAAKIAAQIAGISLSQREFAEGDASATSESYSGRFDDISDREELASEKVRQLWDNNLSPVTGTIAERYFHARGILQMPSVSEARFVSALPYRDGAQSYGPFPAILVAMTNARTGQVGNLLRIYLEADGASKLNFYDENGRKLPPKKVVAAYDGCAMWFTGRSGDLGEEIILCEGPEDALSLRMATGQTAVAAGSWHQLEKVAIPTEVKRIVIVPDDNSDPENPTKDNVGEKGSQRATLKFSAAGIETFVARIPNRKDSNEVLCDEGPDGGVEGLRHIIRGRVPYATSFDESRCLAQAVFDDEIKIILDKPYLVKRLIEPGTLCALYGPSIIGKTFLALDLAAHIAHGKPLAGRAKAPVLYCALEGAAGVDRRIAAIVRAMGASDRRFARYDGHLSFGMDQSGSDSEKALIATCKEIEVKTGEPVALIVIDTLWCAMGGADENSAKDMAGVVARLKRIANATGAAILVVHHPGKDEKKGMRGSSSLFAACDCVLRASEESNKRRVWIEKSKDDLIGPLFTYELKPVSLGKDNEGCEITTCIVDKYLPGKVEEIKRQPERVRPF